MKICWLLSGKNLVGKSSDCEVYSFANWEPMQANSSQDAAAAANTSAWTSDRNGNPFQYPLAIQCSCIVDAYLK